MNARNAIKNSCNIYFSHLADRIDPAVLQKWLFNFGYGHRILPPPSADPNNETVRNFTQAGGIISSSRPTIPIENPEQLPPLAEGEKRYFGLGQGNLRATPLQVANAMAAIARGGLYLAPQLFIEDNMKIEQKSLGISQQSLDTIYDGMRAVVNEPEGTAYNAFSHHRFSGSGVTVYGKTGSTENPEHAWFAGFVKDNSGRSIALAVVVEGGKSGANVAAPLAADIISLCIDARYIGNNNSK
jgi:cell division protein FtsI/penicillin-binding protein 2